MERVLRYDAKSAPTPANVGERSGVMEARHYINELKTLLATSTAIIAIEGVTEREIKDRGLFSRPPVIG